MMIIVTESILKHNLQMLILILKLKHFIVIFPGTRWNWAGRLTLVVQAIGGRGFCEISLKFSLLFVTYIVQG